MFLFGFWPMFKGGWLLVLGSVGQEWGPVFIHVVFFHEFLFERYLEMAGT